MVAESLERIFFSVSPPLLSSQCVLNYTITVTSSDGSEFPDITLEVSDNITHIQSGFELCVYAYNFTVVANTLTGPGQSAVVTSPRPRHFLSKFYS